MPSNWAKIGVCHKRRGRIKCHKRRPTINSLPVHLPLCCFFWYCPPKFTKQVMNLYNNFFLLLLHRKYRIVTIISILYQFTTSVRCLLQNVGFDSFMLDLFFVPLKNCFFLGPMKRIVTELSLPV